MMRICGSSPLLVVFIVAFGGSAVVSAADVPDPAIGTWTLNCGKVQIRSRSGAEVSDTNV